MKCGAEVGLAGLLTTKRKGSLALRKLPCVPKAIYETAMAMNLTDLTKASTRI
jgi:hypothetical protein